MLICKKRTALSLALALSAVGCALQSEDSAAGESASSTALAPDLCYLNSYSEPNGNSWEYFSYFGQFDVLTKDGFAALRTCHYEHGSIEANSAQAASFVADNWAPSTKNALPGAQQQACTGVTNITDDQVGYQIPYHDYQYTHDSTQCDAYVQVKLSNIPAGYDLDLFVVKDGKIVTNSSSPNQSQSLTAIDQKDGVEGMNCSNAVDYKRPSELFSSLATDETQNHEQVVFAATGHGARYTIQVQNMTRDRFPEGAQYTVELSCIPAGAI
ncbi:MAG: hypothetical protein IPJ88_03290 [Myxococcales bacterium]|nr:MAG: hypothetical protein IPJ88_03290 [Myxococcales bacterium]